MKTAELRNNIEKVLGNNIRCLLPSYWWKRLFHQVADTIDEVNGVDIVSSEYALNRVDAPIGSLASIANKKAMKPSECYVPTDEDSNLTDEELVAKLTRLTGLEVSFPLPDITGVEAAAVLVGEDAGGEGARLGFLAISEGFCAAIFLKSFTEGGQKVFLLTSQISVNSLNAFLKQHKIYWVGLDFEPEDTEEYIKETTELFDQIFTIVDCTSDVYVKGLAWERLAKEGESGSASVPSYTLYYTTYKVNGVTTMADKYINLNKEEYAKISASQKAKENYLLQVVELGSSGEFLAPVDVELSWFSLADLTDTDTNFNVTVCSFLQWDGANQPQRRLVSFKSDGTAEYELIPTGDVKFLYYADGVNSLSAKEKAHNASAILSIKNSFDSSFTPSPIIIRYKINSTKYLSLQGILSGNDAEGDGVSLTAFVSPNQYFRFNYDLATGEPAKAESIQIGGGEGSYDDTEIREDIANLSETKADKSLVETIYNNFNNTLEQVGQGMQEALQGFSEELSEQDAKVTELSEQVGNLTSSEAFEELTRNVETWNGAIDVTYLNLLESWDLTGSTGYTNYIAAKPNTQYSFYRGATPQLIKPIAILEYDADKKQIKSTAANSITTTENTAYIRVNEYKSVVEKTMVVEGDYVPTKYLSHEDSKVITTENQTFNDGIAEIVKRDVLPTYEVDGEQVKARTLPINANDWLNVLPYNIIDADAIIPNKQIISTTGELVDYSYSDVTDFIAVMEGEKYTKLSGVTKVYFYDDTQHYIGVSASETKNDFIIPQGTSYMRCVCQKNKTAILTSEDVSAADSGDVAKILKHKNEMHETMMEMLASAGSKVLVGEKYNLITALREASLSNGLFTYLSGTSKYISNKIEGIKGEYNFYVEGSYNESILSFNLLCYDVEDNLVSNTQYSGTRTFILTEDCAYFRVYINRSYDACLVRGSAEDVVVYRDADTLKVRFRNDDYREQIMRDMLTNPKADKLLLNTLYPQLFGKKYAALGDSLTNGTGAVPYCQVVAEYFGMNMVNYGIVSSTLAEYDQAGGGYEPMSVRYANMDADAEVVTIMGGTNDIYSKIGTMSDRQENGQFTLYSGAHKLFKGIMEKYPNAKVGVILPPQFAKCLPTDTEGTGPDINLEKHQARLAAIKEVAEFYSLPVLDLCHHGGINGYGAVQRELFFQADKLHLTTAGQARLAEKVIAWMKTL